MLTLAERITGGEARHLADVLPAEIAPPLDPPEDVASELSCAPWHTLFPGRRFGRRRTATAIRRPASSADRI
ncbi:hypothetical protein [Streptomyces sp. NPDC005262]|uniref:hypothetical protein n=1 Tax=Streptomyces sp. NPDC005262 TaxID=3364710 RepID=UPI00369C0742